MKLADGRLRRALTGTAALAAVASGAAFAPDARATPGVGPEQQLAGLLTSHKVVSKIHGRPSWVTRVSASRPITGGRTVLPVSDRTTVRGVRWLRVMVPGRPNGRSGWIKQRGTILSTTGWHLMVRTSSRRVLVYRHGRPVRTFLAIVGKVSTPTPRGHFFVEESVRMLAGQRRGAVRARTERSLERAAGVRWWPGADRIHGVANLGGTPGTAVSHGCVRLDNASISWLAARIAPGVPVTIR